MSEDIKSSSAPEVSSTDLMSFCMHLVNHSQWKSQRLFLCGSMGEISLFREIVYELKVDKESLDTDRMMYPTSRYAANCASTFPYTFTGDIIRIYTEDVHTGYVRLIREKDSEELFLRDLLILAEDEILQIHGPAVLGNNKTNIIESKFSLGNIKVNREQSRKLDFEDSDNVYAVHSPYWPVEATEWITRRRSYGFPSKSVIKQVVRYGCDFVQVSHKSVSDNNDWRFSFSRAELLLAKNWTTSQRIIYSNLWVINKDINKKIPNSKLCSYYFKTLMFWACEEKNSEFWSDSVLNGSVSELLKEMKKCLESRSCANYFIPSNNMMDHLIDTDLSHEIEMLEGMAHSYNIISRAADGCKKEELESANNIRQVEIEAPDWINRAFLILRRVDNDDDNYAELFCTELKPELEKALEVELSDIYRALFFQKAAADSGTESKEHLVKSERYLLFAANLCDLQERVTIKNNSVALDYIFVNEFRRVKNFKDENDYEEKCENEESSASHSDDSRLNVNKMRGREICIKSTITVNRKNQPPSETYVHFREWHGWSPTVNISWFIAEAYLANLYYITQRDVSLTIKTCDDIIDVYKMSKMNHRFAERTFPVILSTQWGSIYDKEIQELLGFYSLCSYVFDASSRSVYLGVCPIQFALYLKLRLARVPANNLSIEKCKKDWEEHIKCKEDWECRGDNRVFNGRWLLTIALLIH